MTSRRLLRVVLLLATLPLYLSVISSASAQHSVENDWPTVQSIVGKIHGVATAPPTGLITPKYTSGALMGNGDIGVVAGGSSTAEQRFFFAKSDFWGTHWNARHNAPEVSILSLGSLTIASPVPATAPNAVYHVDQDILHAEVDTDLQLGRATVHLRSWTSDSENTFVTEITTASGGAATPIQLRLAMPAPDAAPHVLLPAAAGVTKSLLWASRENDLNAAKDYKARAAIAVRLLNTSFANTSAEGTTATGIFSLQTGKPVWIITTFQSDARIGTDGPTRSKLAQLAAAHVESLSTSKIQALQAEHRAWWKRFWLRSYVQLHDDVLQNYYYGALYVMGSSSRPGKQLPPSLWSNFLTTDDAAWGGRYFMNYNEEAPYYGVFSSNHADLAVPYNHMVLAQIPWQENRTAAAGYRGVSYQRTFSPFTVLAPAPALVPVAASKDFKKLPSDQKSNATFSFLPVIQYYDYTQNKQFLQTQLYPALKQLDAFWRDFAVRDASGKHWVFEHTSAHEGGNDVNPNLDLGFARRVERELISTSQLLGVDAQMRPVWQSFLNQLSPYPTGTVDGHTVYYIAASVENKIKNHGLFEPGDQPINLEGLVFPGENLAIGGNAQQLQIAHDSLAAMNSWAVTRGGNSFNGFCKVFPIAARIGWPAEDLINKLKAAILYQWRPSNLTVAQGGGGIETAGSVEAIDSMLLQHEDGVLRVFPDWPATRDASFSHLLAKGAFLVSSQQLAGHVTQIDIISEQGGSLTLQSPWGTQAVHLNRTVLMHPNTAGQIVLQTQPNGRYRLTAQ